MDKQTSLEPQLKLPFTSVGNYNVELSRILGKGSYETVYQAQHKTTKQLCAVKHITFPVDAAQFAKIEQAAEREWMILQKVSHTNIVK